MLLTVVLALIWCHPLFSEAYASRNLVLISLHSGNFGIAVRRCQAASMQSENNCTAEKVPILPLP